MATQADRSAQDTAAREIVTTRVYDAPRELVFAAWSSAEHLAHWWGPDGFTITTHEFAFHPGGVWRFIMHGPDGRNYPNVIVFEEIAPPERITFKHGGTVDGVDVQFHNTVTFVERGARTELTLRGVFPTAEERERVVREYGAIEGGRQTLGRLAEYLATLARR